MKDGILLEQLGNNSSADFSAELRESQVHFERENLLIGESLSLVKRDAWVISQPTGQRVRP